MVPFRRPELFAAIDVPHLRRLLRQAICVAAVLAIADVAGAQGLTTGAIRGLALARDGSAAAGLMVVAHNADTGLDWTDKTRADGTFLMVAMPVGVYAVSVASSPTVELAVNPSGTTEVTLRTGFPADVHAIAANEPDPDENGDGLISARGLEPTQNGSATDGVDATQSYGGVPVGTGSDPSPDPDGDGDSAEATTGPGSGMARGRHAGAAYVYSQASVREFRVTGNNYSAQTGRAGDVATTVTRAGGRELHGSAFFTLRSQALAARSPLALATSYSNGVVTSAEVKPHDLRENFGFAIGGPVGKLRAVNYFYSFDEQRRGFPAVSSPADPKFYSLTATQTALLANRGVSSAQTGAALGYLSSLTGLVDRRADQTLNFGRADWRIRPRVATSADYNRVRWTAPAGLINAPVVARGRASLGSASGSLDMVLLRVTTNLSVHTVNQARVGYIGNIQYETPQTPLAQEPAISPGGLAPEVNIGPNGLLFGTPASLSQIAFPDERRIQFTDTVTLVRGRNLVEAGGDVSWVRDRVATLANAAGTFTYDSGSTGGKAGGLVDFINDYIYSVHAATSGGCPSIYAATHLFCFRSFSQSFGKSSVAFSTAEWAGFLEDTWRPRPRMTIHVGARYEYQLLPVPVTPNASLDAVFGSRVATSVFPEDRNNLGPRASLSWQPFGAGRGVLHVGYGAFFGQVPGATIRAALSDTGQAGSTTRVRIRPSVGVVCPQILTSGFGYPCAFSTQPTGVVAATTSTLVFDRRFRLPMVQQGSISLEHNVGLRTKIVANYVFNLDRQLPSSTDLNIAASTGNVLFQLQGGTGAPGVRDGETFRLPVYTGRVSPNFGPVTDIVSNVNATYSGLRLEVETRPIRTATIRADYSWSRAIDFGQAQSSTPRTNGQLDPFTKGYDKGLSSLNYPQSLRVTATWNPRLEHGPSVLRNVADGWWLTPIFVARSGRPYTFDLSGGTYLPGGHQSLNGSGGALYLPTVGRNTLRLPATLNVDLRATRSFRAGGRVRLLGSVEAFNLLNHQNVTSVSQRAYLVGTPLAGVTPLVFQSAAAIATEGLNTQAFGTPTATGTNLARERQVQVGVRVLF